MIDTVDRFEDGSRLQVLSPIMKNKKGTHKDLFEKLRKEGYVRIRVDGETRFFCTFYK